LGDELIRSPGQYRAGAVLVTFVFTALIQVSEVLT